MMLASMIDASVGVSRWTTHTCSQALQRMLTVTSVAVSVVTLKACPASAPQRVHRSGKCQSAGVIGGIHPEKGKNAADGFAREKAGRSLRMSKKFTVRLVRDR
jgi:hypothetical protein